MLGIVIWLVFVAVGYLALYLVIKAAINNSEMSTLNRELRSIINQGSRQHEEFNKQMEEMKQLLKEQNQLLREQKPLKEQKDK